MQKREEALKKIVDEFSHWEVQLANLNTLSLYDTNVFAEHTVCGLLNLIYGYELKNLNADKGNFPAIDLGDKVNRVAVQVTSTKTSNKIEHTIAAFIEHELHQDFDQLLVVILGKKQKAYSVFDTRQLFEFSHERHILDFKDLLNRIKDLPTPRIEEIATFLVSESQTRGSEARTPAPRNLPYGSLGHLFKGRGPFMRRLRESLLKGTPTAVVSTALHGLGGIGKTRLAVEYAWLHQQEYSALLFVIADSPEALRTSLAALCGPLVLNLPEQEVPEQDKRLAAVVRWLRQTPNWLLILDNLDTPEAVAEAQNWLSQLTGGHILCTGRQTQWSRQVEKLQLDLLSLDDSTDFLLERTAGFRSETPADHAEAQVLAQLLGGLALALEQAGAYIETRSLSFQQYRQEWERNHEKVLAWHKPQMMQYPASVATTWLTSFAQLDAPARTLLNRLAWLAPAPIPRSLLDMPVPDVKEIDTREAEVQLWSYSLVTRLPETDSFSVHQLVQDVTRGQLSDETGQSSLVEALVWVNVAFEGDPHEVDTWPRLTPLIPHALAVANYANCENKSPSAIGRLLSQAGLLYHQQARLVEAEPLHRRALVIREANYGPDHPDVATSLNNLAGLLRATNRLAEAEPLYRRALAIWEVNYGPDHPDVANVLNNLAELLRDTNRLVEAEPFHRRALAIWELNYGSDHPDLAISLNNLALLLRDMGRLVEAEILHRRALIIRETNYGLNHPVVATSLNNLADLLRITSRLAEAEPLHRRALAIREVSYGPMHPNIAVSLNNLALILRVANRFTEAEPLLRRALAIWEVSHGPNHPDVATSLNNLADLLWATSRLAEAEPLFQRALAIREASYGPDHPRVAISLNNLGGLLRARNRLAEAEPLFRRAMAIWEASYGPNHPNIATCMSNLADLLWVTSRSEETEPVFRRVLAILISFQEQNGHQHPNFQTAVHNYITCLVALGKTESEITASLAELGVNIKPSQPE